MCGHFYRTSDIGSLCRHHRWIDAREEHLSRYIVACDRQLHESITSKDDQSDLIVREVIHQVLYHHLTTIQTTRHNILCHHGVTDIHTDNRLDTNTLLVINLRTHLRTGQHHNQQRQRTFQNPELHRRTESRHIGHQRLQQRGFAELTESFFLVPIGEESDECQYGDQHQQIEIYGVFKSEHRYILQFNYYTI